MLVGLSERLEGNSTFSSDAFPSLLLQFAGAVETHVLSTSPSDLHVAPLPPVFRGKSGKKARAADAITKWKAVMHVTESAREVRVTHIQLRFYNPHRSCQMAIDIEPLLLP